MNVKIYKRKNTYTTKILPVYLLGMNLEIPNLSISNHEPWVRILKSNSRCLNHLPKIELKTPNHITYINCQQKLQISKVVIQEPKPNLELPEP